MEGMARSVSMKNNGGIRGSVRRTKSTASRIMACSSAELFETIMGNGRFRLAMQVKV